MCLGWVGQEKYSAVGQGLAVIRSNCKGRAALSHESLMIHGCIVNEKVRFGFHCIRDEWFQHNISWSWFLKIYILIHPELWNRFWSGTEDPVNVHEDPTVFMFLNRH